jgi:hypothetical protein
MNNKKLLSVLILALFLFRAHGQPDTLYQSSIIVDGDLSDWDTIESFSSDANTPPDYALNYKMAWDNENLYFLFEVDDDTAAIYGRGIYTDQKPWHVDLVYLHIDTDNSKGTELDGKNDFALRVHRDTLLETGTTGWPIWYGKIPGLDNTPGYTSGVWGTSYQAGFIGMGLSIVQNELASGYNIEMAVPFEFLTKADDNFSPSDLSNGSKLGFRLELHDMDAIDNQSGLSIPSGSGWGDPSTWGSIVLVGEDTSSTGIAIDGEIDPIWDETPRFNFDTIVQPIDASHEPHEVENEADFSGYIKIRWEEEGLYFLAHVKDDSIVKTDKVANSDYLEIGIDPENYKNIADPGFISFTISPGDASLGGRVAPGWGNMPEINYAVNLTNDGYIVECLLPVDVMRNPDMEAGTFIGFDSKINDVDDPVNVKWDHLGWNMNKGYIWRDPFRYGTIELLSGGTVHGYKSPDKPEKFQAEVTNKDVKLTWNKVTNAEGYYLISEISNEDGVLYSDTLEGANDTSVLLTGLNPGIHGYILVAYSTGDARSTPDVSTTFVIEASADDSIHGFTFASATIDSIVVENSSLVLYVPQGTDVTSLVPEVTLGPGATISPAGNVATDFTDTVKYTVTAENGDEKVWSVVVISSPTSIQYSPGQGFHVYPNPVTDILFITGVDFDKIRVLSLAGEELMVRGKQQKLDISYLEVGIYLLEVTSSEGIHVKKFMKTKK